MLAWRCSTFLVAGGRGAESARFVGTAIGLSNPLLRVLYFAATGTASMRAKGFYEYVTASNIHTIRTVCENFTEKKCVLPSRPPTHNIDWSMHDIAPTWQPQLSFNGKPVLEPADRNHAARPA
jgi:hypothetical protein